VVWWWVVRWWWWTKRWEIGFFALLLGLLSMRWRRAWWRGDEIGIVTLAM
jgi:hypothetical protein